MQNKSEHSLGRHGQKSPQAKYDLLVTLTAPPMERRKREENYNWKRAGKEIENNT